MGDFVLAIDPGPDQSAFVQWDGEKIWSKGIVQNDTLLGTIRTSWVEGGELAIEMIASYGMPVGKDVFNTCVWIGRFIQAISIPWHLVYRIDVKNHICHSSKAKDSNIRQALIDRFGPPKGTKCRACKGKTWTGREHKPCEACVDGWSTPPGTLNGIVKDEWAALAVAILWWDRNGNDNNNDQARSSSQEEAGS